MTTDTEDDPRRRSWRALAWSSAALLLLLPWLAMQFTSEVAWTLADFVVAGALLGGTGLLYEGALRQTGNVPYRAAAGLALAGVLLLVWINLAVGIIGAEDHPANLLYAGVLAVGFIGSLVARLRPLGMARTLLAMALAQVLVGLVAVLALPALPESGPVEIGMLTAFFAALFGASAWLFYRAAREQALQGAAGSAR